MSDRVYGTSGMGPPVNVALRAPCQSAATPSNLVDNPQSRLSKRMT